jgi:hypothetical protein
VAYMSELTFLLDLLDQETINLYSCTRFGLPTKKNKNTYIKYEKCRERLKVIIKIIRDYFNDDNKIMATIEGFSEQYIDLGDMPIEFYVNTFIIYDTEFHMEHHDTKSFRISYLVYLDWFANKRYQQELQERKEKGQDSTLCLIIFNEQIIEINWMFCY